MKKLSKLAVSAALGMLAIMGGSSLAGAATIDLFEWAYNIDGTTINTPSSFGPLGTKSFTISGAGSHTVIAYFDHEIDEATNTFFNEYGATLGTPGAGQSWEIDEPGYVYGNIYNNLLASALDNSNGVPGTAPDDVSMAIGWDFLLGADETATLKYFLTAAAPTSGFYLQQVDPDSQASIFFFSSLEIEGGGGGGGTQVPEPSTLLLLGAGLAGLGLYGRRSRSKKVTV